MKRLAMDLMRSTIVGSITVICLFWGAETTAQNRELTLDESLRLALDQHPELTVARARVDARKAVRVGAGVVPFNPELSLAANARLGPAASTYDWETELSQQFEIAGQRARREAVADAELAAERRTYLRQLRVTSASVRLAWVQATTERELTAIAVAELEIARELADLTRRRLDAGAGTQLEVAVAGAELAKAEERANRALGAYAVARAELAGAVGLPAGELPEPVGSLDGDASELEGTLAELVAAATENRDDLLAYAARRNAAERRVELARAEGWPSPTVGVFAGREANTETLVGGSVTIPLPLFSRNQGAIAVAEAEVAEVDAEAILAEREVQRSVAIAFEQYRSSRLALQNLRRSAGETEEALQLLRRSYEVGKNTWVEILVMRRAMFDAQRAVIELQARTRRARIELDVAVGRTPIPDEVTRGLDL